MPIPPRLSIYCPNLLLKEQTRPSFPSMILNFKINLFCSKKQLRNMKKDIINQMKRSFVFQQFIFTIKEELKLSLHTPRIKYQKLLRIRLFITRCQTHLTIRMKITTFLILKQQSREKSEWSLASVISSKSKLQKSIDKKTSNSPGLTFKKPSVL